jgi:CheY-like chemotaxis protein
MLQGVGDLLQLNENESRGVVLVVEDNTTVFGATAEALELRGYTVLAAKNGASALAIAENTAHIDLLLSDVILEDDMNGLEVARALLAQNPGLKVVYMSGYPKDVLDKAGKLDGPLLNKPFGADRLAGLIEEALGGGADPTKSGPKDGGTG